MRAQVRPKMRKELHFLEIYINIYIYMGEPDEYER